MMKEQIRSKIAELERRIQALEEIADGINPAPIEPSAPRLAGWDPYSLTYIEATD